MTDHPPYDPDPPWDSSYDNPSPAASNGSGSRTPPQDMLAEQSVLGAMLISAQAIDDVTGLLDAGDFYRPAHEQIYAAITSLHARGDQVDMVTVAAELARRPHDHKRTQLEAVGGALYLQTLASAPPTAGGASTYAGLVRDAAQARTVVALGTRLTQLGYAADPEHLDTNLDQALQALDDVARQRIHGQHTKTSSWAALALDEVLAGHELDPPPALLRRDDGQQLLYAGAVHTIAGEPGSGKTWITLLAAVQQITAEQHVVMIDFEDRASRVVGRLLALGAHPDQVLSHFRYVRPNAALDTRGRDDLEHVTSQASLVILDGVTEAMTLHGLDLSANPDVARFYELLPRAIADRGPAVVMIDHVVKENDKQGRWALGGQHKLAGIDGVSYLVRVVEAFGRGKIGHARISVAKDRPGYIEELAVGRTVAELHLDARDPVFIRARLRTPDPTPVDESGAMRPTVYMERVSRWLELHPGANKTEIEDSVSGKKTYVRKAINRLVDEGYVEVSRGTNREQFHQVLTPFRIDPEGGET